MQVTLVIRVECSKRIWGNFDQLYLWGTRVFCSYYILAKVEPSDRVYIILVSSHSF